MNRKGPERSGDSAGEAQTEQQPGSAEHTPAGQPPVVEIGGRAGPDPIRYGDWEKNGRCIDF
ncbi:MAG: DUF1674 domain-containing protein [Xanthomonadales bacterium]|nr:DUF1674 domain-containing protein [Xanthomonadales bacterium]